MTGTPDEVKNTPEAEAVKPDQVNTANGATAGAMQADAPAAEAALQAQLAEAQAKASEYLEQLRRERASFENFRKRTDKEREEANQNATVDTLRKLLPVIDDFERAIANVPPDKANDEVIKGFSLIHRKLLTLLDSAGIKVLDPVGTPFDPAFHEALGQDDASSVKSGHVSAVLQKGYVYGERVLRPALVRVAN
jgi:molecular chaperone GrpE